MTFFPYMLHFKAPKKIKILAAETWNFLVICMDMEFHCQLPETTDVGRIGKMITLNKLCNLVYLSPSLQLVPIQKQI